MNDVTVPHDREAEDALIGSVLIYGENFFQISETINVSDFYIIRNGFIWEAFEELIAKKTPIDPVTVSSELESKKRLVDVGGFIYFTELIARTPSSINVSYYAKIVKDASIKRSVLQAMNEGAQLAYSSDLPTDQLLETIDEKIARITNSSVNGGIVTIKDVASELYDHVAEKQQMSTDELMGVPTGLIDLDNLLGGLQKSDFILVAGRPGTGKTALMLTVAKNAAKKHKKHVGIFSLEMSNQQLVQRLVSQITGINTQKIRTGRLDPDEMDLFTKAIGEIGDLNIHMDDTPSLTPLKLMALCKQVHRRHAFDLIIVDYVQLMSGGINTHNRVQEVSYISRYLKILAKELNVPVLVGAQLSRAIEHRPDRKPKLADLRESGSLEQDADIVIFIHEDEPENPNIIKAAEKKSLVIAKHRNGETHSGLPIMFFKGSTRFDNAARLP